MFRDVRAKIAAIVAVGFILTACSGDDPSTEPLDYRDSTLDVELRVELLMEEMTLREKVAEMSGPPFSVLDLLLLVTKPMDIGANERLGIPALRMAGSSRGAIVYGTAFPVSMARGASWNPALEERIGEAIGAELAAAGGNVLLGPTINLLRHPGWGRAQETYGEDPHHLARLAVASIHGIQRHVMAQVKHFALNSIEDDRGVIDVIVTERTLREVYLPHFKAAVLEGGVASVMSSYNRVNGQYMGENEHLLRDILKGDWAFDGFVASDWYDGVRSTATAANNGLDIEMPCEEFYGEALYEAVQRGEVEVRVIDEAVERILRAKFRFGLFEREPRMELDVLQCPEHTALALEAAREGIVLLRNEAGALPLVRDEIARIAVVGRLADQARLGDLGSSIVVPGYAISPLSGVLDLARGVEVVSYTGADPEEAAALASEADAVIVVAALTALHEGEFNTPIPPFGGDRTDLALPERDVAVIRAVAEVHDRVVVMVEAGGGVTVEPWIDEVEALALAWYPGMEGGRAIAEVLFGDVNPSGRLPFTLPHTDDPIYPFGSGWPSIEYGYFHGYRYFDREALAPRFPFGFGLSYTDFAYDGLRLSDTLVHEEETIRVSFEVTNTGAVVGKEVVQLYVGCPGVAVERPLRELKAFDKIELAPGETRTVTLDLSVGDLAYYEVEAKSWRVEEGAYIVEVGRSSRDLPLQGAFVVE